MNASAQRMKHIASSWREESAAFFAQHGFAGAESEAWKYSSVRTLPATLWQNPASMPAKQMIELEAVDHYRAVLLDGVFMPSLSALPQQMQWRAIDAPLWDVPELRADEGHRAFAQAHTTHGLVLDVPAGVILDKPIELTHMRSVEAGNQFHASSMWAHLGAGSQAVLIERFVGGADSAMHSAHHMNYVQQTERSSFSHYVLNDATRSDALIHSSLVQLGSRSTYDGYAVHVGGHYTRHEVRVVMQGDHATASQSAIAVGQEKQNHDLYYLTRHDAPFCTSHQHVRHMMDDASKGVYYGRVEVPKHGVKAEAHQLHKSMLLSPKAQVMSRPELDILTDDVVCSHGSTTGALDAMAVYYLTARGIDEHSAQQMLQHAFIAQMLDAVKHDDARAMMHNLLPMMESL
ncbi:MAG: hypothetical protein EAY65_00920 [Alphaproteobacteria bacterium]|nr:MAG: hypothetical protein EAY65_00920 [Alphaproteobacteria bacterium]